MSVHEMKICERIRHEIRQSKLPIHRIAVLADIPPAMLYKFIAHKDQGLNVKTIDKLLPVLGLQITEIRRHKGERE